jgi:sialate O-acetylesterase
VGFYFGRQLHQILDIPVGLIDNAWGGSACEAWVRRDLLESDSKYTELMERWTETEANYDAEKVKVDFEKKLNRWKEKTQAARKAGTPLPKRPRSPRNPLLGQHRPANLYNGVLKPIIGYPIQGVVWYQGEANAGRAYQYRDLFPLMINHWRDEWKIGDFAFYWVQLADFRDEKPEPTESDWAELREAQTMTMSKLNNTGEAVIIDVGESNNIHPRNKLVVGMRLARWALAKQYGYNIVHRSPIFRSMEVKGNKVVVTFDHVGSGLKNHDFREIRGFALASGDGPFKTASAKIVGKNQVEVWADDIKSPTAVRYAWADNPVCNLISHEGLPVTPFRTDKRPGVTINNRR